MPLALTHYSPARTIILTILLAISIGAILLKLPFSTYDTLSWLDAVFTSTACLCTCGLSTIPFDSFTKIGQCFLLLLIQAGGLGLITCILFFMSFFIKFGFTTQVFAGQMMELESWKDIKKIIFFIITFTLSLEIIVAIVNFFWIYPHYSCMYAIFLSIFNSVSHFCHAGVSLFPNGMIAYKSNGIMLLANSIIMVAGGLGFITWYEIFKYIKSLHKRKRFHFSLQTKIILTMTVTIVIIAALMFWMLERDNTLQGMPSILAAINALYNAIAARGTGFATVNTNQLQLATLLFIMVLAFIGSAPGSTGSGIKVTTLAIIIAIVKAALSSKTHVSIMGRSIAKDQVLKAIIIFILSLVWIVFITFLLLITEQGYAFSDILFETISAYATLGLSTGITPNLSSIGKCFIIITMIVGRVSALTLLLALYKKHDLTEFSYPEERIIVG